VRLRMRWRIAALLTTAALITLLLSLALSSRSGTPIPPAATPCEDVFPGCHATRLPNLILTGSQTSGAFKSVDGFSLKSIISFDEALRRAGGGWNDAKTVQVVLGSADATPLRWGTGWRLYYGIEWTGICVPSHGPYLPTPPPGVSPLPRPSCFATTWGTVIDATTGVFVVEGT